MSDAYEFAELQRVVASLVLVGLVEQVDGDRAEVRFGEAVTDGLPWLVQRAGEDRDWWAPTVGEQVLVIAPEGDLARAIILGSLYQDDMPAPADAATVRRVVFGDGAVIEYDREAHHLRAVLPDGAQATIVADGGVSIVGELTVNGDIEATGDVSDAGGALSRLRDNYNTHTHVGNLGGPTGTPQPEDQ